tara:strand:- start:298 stop:444 length:147 start_codon:yes stop_codon:yes gene_type:complete
MRKTVKNGVSKHTTCYASWRNITRGVLGKAPLVKARAERAQAVTRAAG